MSIVKWRQTSGKKKARQPSYPENEVLLAQMCLKELEKKGAQFYTSCEEKKAELWPKNIAKRVNTTSSSCKHSGAFFFFGV